MNTNLNYNKKATPLRLSTKKLSKISKTLQIQIVLIVLAAAMMLAQNSFAQTFASGSDFSSIPVSGQVTMTCNDGSNSKTVSFQCRDISLSPVEYDFFVGPRVDANQVTLNVLRADGTSRFKTIDYDGSSGRSTQRFNLWINALFQNGLLSEGANTIDYRLTKSSALVTQGRFVSNVRRGAPLTCPTASLNSTTLTDCETMYTTCQRYFAQFNYCK
jgi:hypothetical protein